MYESETTGDMVPAEAQRCLDAAMRQGLRILIQEPVWDADGELSHWEAGFDDSDLRGVGDSPELARLHLAAKLERQPAA